MCGGHQRTPSNRRLPSSQSKPTAVDRQKYYSIILKTPPRASKIQQERKETEERISEVPPRGVSQAASQPLLARCACAPVNKTDHQCWTATHVDTVNSTRPHELRVISVVLDVKLAHAQWPPSRSRVPTNAPNLDLVLWASLVFSAFSARFSAQNFKINSARLVLLKSNERNAKWWWSARPRVKIHSKEVNGSATFGEVATPKVLHDMTIRYKIDRSKHACSFCAVIASPVDLPKCHRDLQSWTLFTSIRTWHFERRYQLIKQPFSTLKIKAVVKCEFSELVPIMFQNRARFPN